MRQRQGSIGLVFMFIFNPIIILFYQNCSLTTQSSIATQKEIFRGISSIEQTSGGDRSSLLYKNNGPHLKINFE